MNHVDYNMFGSLALKLYQVTKDERYRKMGLEYADTQWELPRMRIRRKNPGQIKGFPGKQGCGLTICT